MISINIMHIPDTEKGSKVGKRQTIMKKKGNNNFMRYI
jgi:hypothetical protein